MLQSIINSLKKLDWPTATIEFVLLVFGIFLALQVDNWNEERKNARDETVLLNRLHQDIWLADQLTRRLRERRISVLRSLKESVEILQSETGTLSDAQCFSIGASAFFNINISGLPTFAEMLSTGRMAIVEDDDIRANLVGLQQIKTNLDHMQLTHLSLTATSLPSKYPHLISASTYLDAESGEVRVHFECNDPGMQTDRGFKSDLALNLDTYDAYLRDGLAPWFDVADNLHELLDKRLSITH